MVIKKLKKVATGLDTKANPALTLHEQMLAFFNMLQGQTESDDNYLSRFNFKLKN